MQESGLLRYTTLTVGREKSLYSARSSVPQDLQTRMDAIQVKLSHLSSACMCKRAYR
jgi:hypothetical protein